MVYKYRTVGFSVAAQVVGERLEEIREANDGLRPKDVVKDARPKTSPLHPLFEWDDRKAAALHREDQAATLIRSVVVVKEEGDDAPAETPHVVQAFLAIGTKASGSCYTTTAKALSDPELRQRVLADAIAQLRGWQNRYGHLEELAGIVAAIQDIEAVA